jgi:hypothetical protein
MTEEEHDAQYDQEQLDLVHAAMSSLEVSSSRRSPHLSLPLLALFSD